VLGHELAHVVNRDILVSSIAVVLAGSVAMATQLLGNAMLFGGGDREDRSPASGILSLALIILAPLAATVMQLAISRRRESLADASGALLTGRPLDLATALRKIGGDQAPLAAASDATAHLWIANPFKGRRAASFVHKLFMTHPPLEERVAALEAMAGER
jgi:heat shock protein HtpX